MLARTDIKLHKIIEIDCIAVLMGMTWDIDARIEPHQIKAKDVEEGNPFVKEIIDTGIKVA